MVKPGNLCNGTQKHNNYYYERGNLVAEEAGKNLGAQA